MPNPGPPEPGLAKPAFPGAAGLSSCANRPWGTGAFLSQARPLAHARDPCACPRSSIKLRACCRPPGRVGCARLPGKSREGRRRLPLGARGRRSRRCRAGLAAMADKPFLLYSETPDGTDCHLKAYASTSIAGAVGERRPGRSRGRASGGRRGRGPREVAAQGTGRRGDAGEAGGGGGAFSRLRRLRGETGRASRSLTRSAEEQPREDWSGCHCGARGGCGEVFVGSRGGGGQVCLRLLMGSPEGS